MKRNVTLHISEKEIKKKLHLLLIHTLSNVYPKIKGSQHENALKTIHDKVAHFFGPFFKVLSNYGQREGINTQRIGSKKWG